MHNMVHLSLTFFPLVNGLWLCWRLILKISVNFSWAMAQEQVNSSTQTLICSACIIITWILSKCNSQIYGWMFGFLQISPYRFFDSRMVTVHGMFTEGYWKYHLRSCLTAVLFLCCMSGHRNLSRWHWKILLTIICINLLICLLHFMWKANSALL